MQFPIFSSSALQRPTTKELLQHRFIKGARKTSYLTELTERYQEFRARSPNRTPQMYQASVRNSVAWDGTLRSDWNFDTIRSNAAMGSLRSMARDIITPGSIPDEEEYLEEDPSLYDASSVVDSNVATTRGSNLPPPARAALGMTDEGAHSTVIIRSLPTADEKDLPSLVQDNTSDETTGSAEPSTPPTNLSQTSLNVDAVEPPPAYTGSMRSSRRSSYAARNNVATGTVLAEADLGSGVDTIRPVKKVDTVRSLRLSSEYVGSIRSRDAPGRANSPTPPSPPSPKSPHRRIASEAVKAGRTIVDDIVLPVIEKATRDDMDAREIESLSMISRGFEELRDVNPELAYNIILDLLTGINEYVLHFFHFHLHWCSSAILQKLCRSAAYPICSRALPPQARHSEERDDC